MNRLIAMLLTALTFAATAASSAPTQPAAAPKEPDMSTSIDYTAPGPEHAVLARLVGRWTSVYHVTRAPGAPAADLPGSAEFRTILDGRWIAGDTELRLGDLKIAGLSIYGFDRFKQRYTMLFIQQADTQPLFGYGVADAGGKRITFEVPMDLPMAGLRAVPMRTVLDLSSPDSCSFEMNAPQPGGTEFRPLRIDYTRAK